MLDCAQSSSRELLKELEECVSQGARGKERCALLRSVLARRDDVSPDDIVRHVRFGAKTLLRELEKFVSWVNVDKVGELEASLDALPEVPARDVVRAKKQGVEIRNALNDFEQFVGKTFDEKEVAKQHDQLRKKYPFLSGKLAKILEYQANRMKRQERNQNLRKSGKPLSSVSSKRPHAIHTLDPCASWDLVIDESGCEFEVGASGTQVGKIVGLLVPRGCDLPALKGFHAISVLPEDVDQAVQAVLDRPVGVFGISVSDIPEAIGERWMDGVCEVIHWVWQLLPIAADALLTDLHVHIENRGMYDAKLDLKALEREMLRQWARIDSSRKVRLSMCFASKDGHEYLGYVDALAFTWGSPAQESRERLKKSGLTGECLQSIGSGRKLRDLRDFYARPELLDGEYWKWLTGLPESNHPGSLSGYVLGRLAIHCSANPSKWDEYVSILFDHLESKALDLQVLGRQCSWLAQCRPAGTVLPVVVELMWNVALLANKNHLGQTECRELISAIRALGDSLLEEDARLVCKADLHLAVQATNRFEFEEATHFMGRWQDLSRLEESFRSVGVGQSLFKHLGEMMPLVVGLQLAGRVKSTIGQHLAFVGKFAEAREMFESALIDFEKLSDRASARRDKEQTGTYLAIAAMDDPECPRTEVVRLVETVLGPLSSAIDELASSTKVQHKYMHHLLVRYLVQCGDARTISEYLLAAKSMRYDYGHPWPLIQFYRCLMAKEHALQLWEDVAKSVWELAFESNQGSTVRFIGMCLGVSLGLIDVSWPVFGSEMRQLREAFPLAEKRLDLLELYAKNPSTSPFETVEALLPFNFR